MLRASQAVARCASACKLMFCNLWSFIESVLAAPAMSDDLKHLVFKGIAASTLLPGFSSLMPRLTTVEFVEGKDFEARTTRTIGKQPHIRRIGIQLHVGGGDAMETLQQLRTATES